MRGSKYVGDGRKNKKSNVSFNECLYWGPAIFENLCTLFKRFWPHKNVLVADIGKNTLQVDLQEKDRNVTRFLWLKDITKPVTTENIAVLRFPRIPFGMISSQFILVATIIQHLTEKGTAVSKKIKKHIYVDILINGTNTD